VQGDVADVGVAVPQIGADLLVGCGHGRLLRRFGPALTLLTSPAAAHQWIPWSGGPGTRAGRSTRVQARASTGALPDGHR
jgi:hypothetical protein